MRPAAVVRAAVGGINRRRVQAIVIAVVLVISTCAAVLAIALVVDSNAPFDKAFAAQHGAHVTVAIDPAKATPAQLATTVRLPQVTAAAGPFPVSVVKFRISSGRNAGATTPFTEMLAGRASPGGPVDDVTLRAGHWPRRDGQIVLGSTWPGVEFIPLGSTVTVAGVPGTPLLTVVGIGTSVTQSADGWVLPGEISRLVAPGAPTSTQMLYQFRSAGTDAAIRGDVAAVTRALPAGAISGTQSYLTIRSQEQASIAMYLPLLIVFGVIGLVMSWLIVANVISGAVVADYSRIGVLKSIGFTPHQVVAAYTIQAMAPAAAGCLAGAVLGVVVAGRLVLNTVATAFGVGTLGGMPAWVAVGAPAAMCALAGMAAVVPTLRAGRFSAVAAIAAGRAPRTGHGYAAHRLLGRLALPRPVTIGLAAPFARPARTAVMLAVILLGAAAVTFGAGVSTSLVRIEDGVSLVKTWQDVVFSPPSGNPRRAQADRQAPQPFTARQQAIAEAAIRAHPGTLHYVAMAQAQATVAGLAQQVPVTAFRSDATWISYPMVSGHWYTGPGQADVPLGFLTATQTKVGDTVVITVADRRVPVRIVGDVFDTDNSGLTMLTDFQTLARADPGLAPYQYAIGVTPGISPFAYQLSLSLHNGFGTGMRDTHGSPIPYMNILTGTLVLLLAIAASLSVVNTVVLHTRERIHDLGVFKAVGMTPRQAVAMVVCWVAGIGLAAGVLAVAAGISLHRYMIPLLAVFAGNGMPPSFLDVFGGWEVAGLALAGLVIAVAGALLPAGWAAGVPAASALRAE